MGHQCPTGWLWRMMQLPSKPDTVRICHYCHLIRGAMRHSFTSWRLLVQLTFVGTLVNHRQWPLSHKSRAGWIRVISCLICRASQADMAAAARGNTEPDEKNIMDDGDWQTNPWISRLLYEQLHVGQEENPMYNVHCSSLSGGTLEGTLPRHSL